MKSQNLHRSAWKRYQDGAYRIKPIRDADSWRYSDQIKSSLKSTSRVLIFHSILHWKFTKQLPSPPPKRKRREKKKIRHDQTHPKKISKWIVDLHFQQQSEHNRNQEILSWHKSWCLPHENTIKCLLLGYYHYLIVFQSFSFNTTNYVLVISTNKCLFVTNAILIKHEHSGNFAFTHELIY